jgi:hypothetical protein
MYTYDPIAIIISGQAPLVQYALQVAAIANVPMLVTREPWRIATAATADCPVLIGADLAGQVVEHARKPVVGIARWRDLALIRRWALLTTNEPFSEPASNLASAVRAGTILHVPLGVVLGPECPQIQQGVCWLEDVMPGLLAALGTSETATGPVVP